MTSERGHDVLDLGGPAHDGGLGEVGVEEGGEEPLGEVHDVLELYIGDSRHETPVVVGIPGSAEHGLEADAGEGGDGLLAVGPTGNRFCISIKLNVRKASESKVQTPVLKLDS